MGYLNDSCMAIACLRDLDDRQLRDIGLARSQIEAAVYGLITISGHADVGMTTFAAATYPRARRRWRSHHGTDGRHDPGHLCRLVPDLLHEGRVWWRILNCRHSLLSIVMDPITAGGLLAPLFIAMDLFALRYWKRSTWSKPDLLPPLPGLVTGIGFGYLLFRFLDHRATAIAMAAITLIFVGL